MRLRHSATAALFAAATLFGSVSAQAGMVSIMGPFMVDSTSATGTTFTLSGTLTGDDTLGLTAEGLSCLQGAGTYCTNAAGVVVIAGSQPVGGSSANGGTTFGALLLTIGGVGTEQLFPTNAANGAGSASPSDTLSLAAQRLTDLGFGSFSITDPVLTFTVSDTNRSDNAGSLTITPDAVADATVPEPASVGLLALGVLGAAFARRRRSR
ncbi:MAG TPA: PEP-CTERM sorting domain-containing protein [Polyangia bacterium]|nr:PEP-CTERM sorting domain-containing protein [Polyangia bacterium]